MMLLSFDDAEELSKALLRNDHIESIELYGLSTENPLLKVCTTLCGCALDILSLLNYHLYQPSVYVSVTSYFIF